MALNTADIAIGLPQQHPHSTVCEALGATALTSLTSAQSAKLYIENGSLVSPCFSVAEIRSGDTGYITRDSHRGRYGVQRYRTDVVMPPVSEIADIIAIAGDEMQDMTLGAKSTDQALACLWNRADEMMRANGHY